ncbi:ABC transporter permease [Labrys wisconsinensis]|uniref:Ribose/xylose/arabinose/galactoside ABC-type transport system permease subunit n=1 Tax=Labrys wisconsinensis TaxID=425677 RepID=A0ABU0J960_9HYPH|nr:ABC transporter permease [Labrys wisconsinensis]MDQ0470808.1 ribose/xylose/arabinose/galactoside ABC-type transport system permease subunit [Labrys wisconsinensis]
MRFDHHLLRRILGFTPLILLVALLLASAAVDPRVVAPASLVNIAAQATPIAVLGIGTFIVLLTAGIDLSAGVGVALCAILIAGGLDRGLPLPAALALGCTAMAAVGLANGLVIAVLRIPPFVTTLATMVAVQGATLAVAQKGVLIVNDPVLKAVGFGRIAGLPAAIVLTALVAALAYGLMRMTRFGLRSYALGSDRGAAELAGVPILRQTVLVYVASGVFTFLAAALMVSRVPVVTPNIGGTGLLLDAIAAAVLGGTSIFGGRGSVGGVVVGALIVSLLTNALRVFGVDPSSIDLFKGLIIMAALLGDAALTAASLRLDRRLG